MVPVSTLLRWTLYSVSIYLWKNMMAMMGQQWKAMIKTCMGIRPKPRKIRLSREKMVVGVLDVNIVLSYFHIVFEYFVLHALNFWTYDIF